jgi:glycosyltransferase involved in cell wall biosynthesis
VSLNQKLLTIAIPTFNRNSVLKRNLELLMPQMEDWVHLLIVDNCSDIPVSDTLRGIVEKHSNYSIEIIRNSVNIGGNANILRCIEHCNSDYIWIIGDDDYPSAGSVRAVYQQIHKKELVWLNCYSGDPNHQPIREHGIVTDDLSKFLTQLKSISELVFVSNNVFSNAAIKQGIEFAQIHQATMAPHVISMLVGVEKLQPVGTYVISPLQLFDSISNNHDSATAWPLYLAFLGIMRMYSLPLSNSLSTKVLHLVRGARKQWLSNKYMFAAFSALSCQLGRKEACRISASFYISLLKVDRFGFFISFPIYIFSIAFGPIINRVRNYKI